MKLDHNLIQLQNHSAENQPFAITDITENTNTSLEVSQMEQNTDTVAHSQPLDSNYNDTTETDFNSTLLSDGTFFSLHTVNTLSLIDPKNNNDNNYNNNSSNKKTNNNTTSIYKNHRDRQLVNSTELTHNSDQLNTTLPLLSNTNSTLPQLKRPKFGSF